MTTPMSDPQNPNPLRVDTTHADQTERHALPPAPASPAATPRAPESRPDWARARRPGRARPTSPRRNAGTSPPTPAPATTVDPRARPAARQRRRARVVGAALLAAVLASGGTVARAQRDRRPRPARPSRPRRRSGQTVSARPAGHHRRVLGDHRRRRQGQPGRRPDHGQRQRDTTEFGDHPGDRRRLRRHLRPERLDPHEPPRRRGRRHARRSSSRTAASSRARSTASTR